jgi:hypothetical protein
MGVDMNNSKEEHQRAIYQQLLSDVGLSEDNESEVIFSGPHDPFVNSPYYLGEGFAALAGAVGMANAIIWGMQGGEGPKNNGGSPKIHVSHIPYAVFTAEWIPCFAYGSFQTYGTDTSLQRWTFY